MIYMHNYLEIKYKDWNLIDILVNLKYILFLSVNN